MIQTLTTIIGYIIVIGSVLYLMAWLSDFVKGRRR